MATTTNFGWETPDDTDLVKDGAAAIRTLGNSIDTSFLDLKGGTTGQVLSKNSGTDLDFTWVAQDDSNAIQNAIVDAKGDLITATAADTPSRLAVGTNNQVLTADSTTATGLKWASVTSGFKGVSLKLTSSVNVSNATYTAVDFTTENFDTDAFHSTSSNTSRITIPAGLAGKYLVIGASGWDNASSSTDRGVRIYKNGSSTGTPEVNWQTNSTGVAYNNISWVFDLAVGDYVELYVIQYNGGTRVLQASHTYLAAVYLGA